VLIQGLESRRIEGYAWRGVEKLLLRLLPTWLLGPILPAWLRLHVVAEAEVGVVGQMGLLYIKTTCIVNIVRTGPVVRRTSHRSVCYWWANRRREWDDRWTQVDRVSSVGDGCSILLLYLWALGYVPIVPRG